MSGGELRNGVVIEHERVSGGERVALGVAMGGPVCTLRIDGGWVRQKSLPLLLLLASQPSNLAQRLPRPTFGGLGS